MSEGKNQQLVMNMLGLALEMVAAGKKARDQARAAAKDDGFTDEELDGYEAKLTRIVPDPLAAPVWPNAPNDEG